MRFHPASTVFVLAATLLTARAQGVEWHVAAGGTGGGSASAPFGQIQDALDVARPGDVIVVGPGTFSGALRSVRDGAAGQPITIRAANGRGSTIVTSPGRVLTVSHAYLAIEGLVLDGQYGVNDLVRLAASATGFVLRDTEVRRTSRDAIDMGAVRDVLIENSLVHHALNADNGRTDAHGIVGGAVQGLTIRNTEIHTFSGDGVQVDARRSAPGWNDVTIEGCRIWLAPLASPENGFPAGIVPGENAVDTKASASLPRARITIRNTEAWGFRGPSSLTNLAAFNLKENIDATVDGVTVYDSEIAFRLRHPAQVRVQNAVVHGVEVAFRYEDGITNLRIWNSTLGNAVSSPFRAASSSSRGLNVRNLLRLGSSLPAEASEPSNLAVDAAAFVDAAAHNYQISASSPALDAGVTISEVATDREGTPRPQGKAYDVGAYERAPRTGPPPAPANLRVIR
jgi:hypothetical protein